MRMVLFNHFGKPDQPLYNLFGIMLAPKLEIVRIHAKTGDARQCLYLFFGKARKPLFILIAKVIGSGRVMQLFRRILFFSIGQKTDPAFVIVVRRNIVIQPVLHHQLVLNGFKFGKTRVEIDVDGA